MKRAIVAFGLITMAGPAMAAEGMLTPWREITVKATIVAWGQEPASSGYAIFYRRIAIAEYGALPRDVWMVWLGQGQSLPPVGAACAVTYHFAGLDGHTVEPVDRLRDYAILDGFSCGPVQ